jgi:hypothetical protein
MRVQREVVAPQKHRLEWNWMEEYYPEAARETINERRRNVPARSSSKGTSGG